MSAPICEFVKKYAQNHPVRLHMPGHKGKEILGFEPFDITETDGADELFAPSGIIAESEAYASEIFNSHTFYSTAGSTLCIQAMLYLTVLYAKSIGKKPLIAAGRNAHKAFLNAAALLGADIEWIFPKSGSYHCCDVSATEIDDVILKKNPTAVYITSPDYLGNIADIKSIAEVCHKHGVLLLTDNAHGAYLKFLSASLHPIDLGADMCCDSAHKTLPVLTGGAYLHIAKTAPKMFIKKAKTAMSLFGSSSPSYLILQSLDAANDYMKDFRSALNEFIPKVNRLRSETERHGIETIGNEPLKITLKPKSFGYSGIQIAEILKENNIYTEFYDLDFVVLMLTPQNSQKELDKLCEVHLSIPKREPIKALPPQLPVPEAAVPPRLAVFSDSEVLPVRECTGRICAVSVISCPPAIPIAVCGERIDEKVIENMKYYGIDTCTVCK